MSLLRQIQDAAASSDVPLSTLLRRCQILASRLGSAEVAGWVAHELNGYPSKDGLPDYRVLRGVQSVGDFSAPGRILKNLTIAPATLPEVVRPWVPVHHLTDGVAVYEEALRDNDDGAVLYAWPADLVALCSSGMYAHMSCLRAFKVVSTAAHAGMLDTVRTRVLGFALEIERANPEAGEAPANTTPVPPQVVSQVFNTQIHGNVANVAAGSTHVTQTAAQHAAARGDAETTALLAQVADALRALREAAADATVEPTVRAEVTDVVDAVTAELECPSPGRFTLRRARSPGGPRGWWQGSRHAGRPSGAARGPARASVRAARPVSATARAVTARAAWEPA